ncbi:MAG: Cyclohexanone monooxygenase [uncultured Acidimicrobiales bacterium]|uniref:Cyclohexanone monooxygenase n=1 Tax=uncultured Acidimicrobiales bacterium TaxID=310071 RepID=A0A6J4IIX1_9ACTN|nr:MAG: Cyclohexanone monooxygenase [uncultured Acidimicrobiales bacterium]
MVTRDAADEVDVVVVGAGFAGLYLLHRLRAQGLSTTVLEAGGDVGGTWYWNRYPGARCDIPTTDYAYTFDPDLEQEWSWTEKYATQPEILSYLGHVADRYDLRRDIELSTRVDAAVWDESTSRWRVRTDGGREISCRHLVMASGCLSVPKSLDLDGADRFQGDVYLTSRWPHEGVDLTGKRVAVIGTGSSGIQSIPIIADQAAQLTVFQRTPNFSLPAHNGPPASATVDALAADRDAYREAARWSRGGIPGDPPEHSALASNEEVRRARFEEAWAAGELFAILGTFNDLLVSREANELVAEMIREKIRSIVDDPETAEALSPRDHPFGTKRPCLDSGYFQTYNLPHVRLVDLRQQPIAAVTETGIDTVQESFEVDAIVYATGFDAMTGALVSVDITGRDGLTLKEKWADGPSTYLGLTTAGFPNLFMITGPGSPSVLSNMVVSIEQHVDWVVDRIDHLRTAGFETIEPTPAAEAGWGRHVDDCARLTLYPTANSWYMGANVPGKPRVFLPYVGGVGAYRQACDEVAADDHLGFTLSGPAGTRCHDGVVRRVQPDVAVVLELLAGMELPPIESLSVADARAFVQAMATERPPGPEVAEVVDGVLPGPEGDLRYRLYRPPGEGPHPVVAYFHGGGWVLGSHDSDDPLCRDLCVRCDAVVVSVDYRHAPEARFPAAADDGFAAVQWIAANTIELGGIPGQLAVAGWSAGANLAAVACHQAREAGGPDIAAQVLLMPVTDADMSRPSYVENGEGYVLTAPLMAWFWDQYADPPDRSDPRASPLRAADLSDLPAAVIVTGELDPLRDEGVAYAEALAAAGVPVRHVSARGHIHTSLTMVDVLPSGAVVRAEVAEAVRELLRAPVRA